MNYVLTLVAPVLRMPMLSGISFNSCKISLCILSSYLMGYKLKVFHLVLGIHCLSGFINIEKSVIYGVVPNLTRYKLEICFTR